MPVKEQLEILNEMNGARQGTTQNWNRNTEIFFAMHTFCLSIWSWKYKRLPPSARFDECETNILYMYEWMDGYYFSFRENFLSIWRSELCVLGGLSQLPGLFNGAVSGAHTETLTIISLNVQQQQRQWQHGWNAVNVKTLLLLSSVSTATALRAHAIASIVN